MKRHNCCNYWCILGTTFSLKSRCMGHDLAMVCTGLGAAPIWDRLVKHLAGSAASDMTSPQVICPCLHPGVAERFILDFDVAAAGDVAGLLVVGAGLNAGPVNRRIPDLDVSTAGHVVLVFVISTLLHLCESGTSSPARSAQRRAEKES